MKILKRLNLFICISLVFVTYAAATSFSNPFNLGSSMLPSATAFYGRHVAVGSDNVVHVVWSSENVDESPEVWYTHSVGNDFTPAKMIHEGLTGTRPAIAVDPANPKNVFVAYSGSPRSGEKTGIRVIKSADGGTTWSASVQICGIAPRSTNPDILVDQAGNPHVAFISLYDNFIRYNFSPDGGTTWPNLPEIVNPGNTKGYGVCLSLSPDEKLHVLFDSDKAPQTLGNKAVYWTWKEIDEEPAIWQNVPAEMLPGSGAGTPYPTLVWDSRGVGHAWFDAKGIESNNRNVYYVRYENESWSSPQAIPSWMPGGSTCLPSAAIDDEDNLYVVYLDALQKDVDLEENSGDLFIGTNRSGEWEYFNLTQNGLSLRERFPAAAREAVNGKFAVVYTVGPVGGPYSVVYQNCFEEPAAEMKITPAKFNVTVPVGCEMPDTLVIFNSGSAPLNYSASIISTGENSWLNFSHSTGEIHGGDSDTVWVTFDAKLLEPGDFALEIRVTSDAANHPEATIPVHLTVVAACPLPCLELTDFHGITGDQNSAHVLLRGNPAEIHSFSLQILYPLEFLFVHEVLPGELTTEFDDFSVDFATPGVIDISGTTQSAPIPPDSEGSLAEILFEIMDCPTGKKVPIRLEQPSAEFAGYFLRHGRLICAPLCQRGDVNRDQEITALDALGAFIYFLSDGNPPPEYNSPCLPEVADVNCDGEVTPLDALYLFCAYLSNLQPPLECFGATEPANVSLQISSAKAIPGSEITCEIQLQTDATLQAVGFDLQFPTDLLEFQRLDPTELTDNWVALKASENTPGVLNIGGFDPTGIKPAATAQLARVVFRVKETAAGSGELVFGNLKDNLAQSKCINGTFATPETNMTTEKSNNLPQHYQLEPNFPNPFNPETRVMYHLPEKGWVQLAVFNALGQKIRTLVSEIQPAGSYPVQWNGRNDAGNPVTSGIYLLRIEVNGFTDMQKLLLVK